MAGKVEGLDEVGTFINLRGANGLEIPVAGYLEAPIEVMGRKFRASFLVSHQGSDPGGRRDKFPILLGCNVLRVIASRVNKSKVRQLTPECDLALRWFDGEKTERSPAPKVGRESTMAEIWTQHCEIVPPDSARLIPCEQ